MAILSHGIRVVVADHPRRALPYRYRIHTSAFWWCCGRACPSVDGSYDVVSWGRANPLLYGQCAGPLVQIQDPQVRTFYRMI